MQNLKKKTIFLKLNSRITNNVFCYSFFNFSQFFKLQNYFLFSKIFKTDEFSAIGYYVQKKKEKKLKSFLNPFHITNQTSNRLSSLLEMVVDPSGERVLLNDLPFGVFVADRRNDL